MILEVAILKVLEGKEVEFEQVFSVAKEYIIRSKGYIEHGLHQCIEEKGKYILLVKWEKLADHTEGFRKGEDYKEWKKLLHHYYNPFPIVEHYLEV